MRLQKDFDPIVQASELCRWENAVTGDHLEENHFRYLPIQKSLPKFRPLGI